MLNFDISSIEYTFQLSTNTSGKPCDKILNLKTKVNYVNYEMYINFRFSYGPQLSPLTFSVEC